MSTTAFGGRCGCLQRVSEGVADVHNGSWRALRMSTRGTLEVVWIGCHIGRVLVFWLPTLASSRDAFCGLGMEELQYG